MDNSTQKYRQAQLDRVIVTSEHSIYPLTIKICGEGACTNYMSITQDEFERIYKILTKKCED